jgi:hypothetical protein
LIKVSQPSEAQAKAGNYKKKHIRYDAMEISIENPAGSVRSGVSKDGTEWSNKMHHHYGYIRGTMGKDKDHVDVFIKPGTTETEKVFVINQFNGKGDFDEHKCMLGFETEEDAKKAYLSNYDKGWECGPIVEMSIEDFKDWVYDGRKSKPAEEVSVKEEVMDKKAYIKEIYDASFEDELSKVSSILSEAWKAQMAAGKRFVGSAPPKRAINLNALTNFGAISTIGRPTRREVSGVVSSNISSALRRS